MADPRNGFPRRALSLARAAPNNLQDYEAAWVVYDEDANAFRIMVDTPLQTKQSIDTFGSPREAQFAWASYVLEWETPK